MIGILLSVVQLCVGVIGLAALVWYCLETRLIRKSSMEQLELQWRPVLVVESGLNDCNGDFGLLDGSPLNIRNVGNGPALNVSYPGRGENYASEHLSALGKGDSRAICEFHCILSWVKLDVIYSSVSGRKYRTRATWTHDGIPPLNNHIELDIREISRE